MCKSTLEMVTELVFMVFVVFQHEALQGRSTTVIPAKLFHDELTTILSSLWTIAKLKILDQDATIPVEFYPFHVGGDPVETMHGMLRCVHHNKNPKIKDLEDSMRNVQETAEVLADDWRPPERRQDS